MAEEIGGISVSVEADTSDLESQLGQAIQIAEDSGQKIAAAFTEGASSTGGLEDAIAQLTAAIGTLSTNVDEMGAATAKAGENAHEAEGGLKAMAEALVGIGEALAITEGLKEFGEEALHAYATVQSVTVGLTQLTKSASEANEIIEQVKHLATTEPFAFPEIAPTVQRMVALGVSAEQIPAVMQAAADSAAATGRSFDSVANAIDRMSLSGTVSARSLTGLGISTEELGRAMGVTAEEVKTAFAALDQEQRIDTLTAALGKFSGSAQAQAETLAGAWQIFQNRFEEAMVGVGQALAPVATALLDFGTKVLKAAQTAIDAFNELPGPVKDTAAALGVAVAALAPLALAAGGVGLAFSALKGGLTEFNNILVALGLRSGEAAVAQKAQAAAAREVTIAEEAAATATETAGTAANTAVFGFKGLDTAVKGASVAIAGLIEYDLLTWADKNVPAFKSMGDSAYEMGQKIIDAGVGIKGFSEAFTLWVTGAVKQGEVATDQLSQATFMLSQKLGDLGVVIPRGTMSLQEWNAALQEAASKYSHTQEAAEGYGTSVEALIAKQAKLNAAEQQAAADLLNVQQLYKDGKVSLDILNAAQDTYNKTLSAANAASGTFADTLAGISRAYDEQQAKITTLEQTHAQLLSVLDRSARQDAELIDVENKLAAAYGAHRDAVANLPKAYDGLVQSADALAKKERDVGDAVGYAKSVLAQAMANADGTAASQRVVTDALNQYIEKLKASGALMTDTITINIRGVDVVTTLGNAIKMLKDGQGDWNTALVNGVSLLRDHQNAATNATPALRNLSNAVGDGAANALKAIGYYNPLSASVNDVGEAARSSVDGASRFAASVNDVGDAVATSVDGASRFANVIDNVGNSAATAAGKLGLFSAAEKEAQAASDHVSNSFAQTTGDLESMTGGLQATTGAVDALSTAIAFLAMENSGLTIFAGSGSALDRASGHYVSASDSTGLLQSQQATAKATQDLAAANAAFLQTTGETIDQRNQEIAAAYNQAHAIDASSTATIANTAVVVSGTTATQAATVAIQQYNGLLNNSSTVTTDALGNVTTAYTTTAQAAQSFVDGLGNVYDSYQALVDAIKANPLLGGPATSSTGDKFSGPSSSDGSVTGPDGKQYASSYALYQAIQANPNILSHNAGGLTDFGDLGSGAQSGKSYTVNGQPATYAQYLASLPGINGPSGSSASFPLTGTSGPSVPGFGLPSSKLQNNSGNAITVQIYNPVVQSQSQAEQVLSQAVNILRNNAGLKL